jgi:hypothetical protein
MGPGFRWEVNAKFSTIQVLYAMKHLERAVDGLPAGHAGFRFTRFSFSAHAPHTHWWPQGMMM